MFSVFAVLALQGALQGHLPLAASPQDKAQKSDLGEYGPPKSAMSDIKIDIKATGRYSYEATVWIEGKPIEIAMPPPLLPDSIGLSKSLGLRLALPRNNMPYNGLWHGAVVPPLMDDGYVRMSGPTKVVRVITIGHDGRGYSMFGY